MYLSFKFQRILNGLCTDLFFTKGSFQWKLIEGITYEYDDCGLTVSATKQYNLKNKPLQIVTAVKP